MSLNPNIQNYPTPNFPKPLSETRNNRGLTFPSDLLSDSRKFHTQIQFVEYKLAQQINSSTPYAVPKNGIKLPLPMKINDNLVVHWSPVSITDAILGSLPGGAAAGVSIAQLGGAAVDGGLALNPLMFMLFQRPEYRSFSLAWTLTPKNEKESQDIKEIITLCKQAASPERSSFSNLLMTYPMVALIKMHPDDIFGHMVFKPCIITSVLADYTASPTPAFHKNGAPAAVSLVLNVQEMQFWYRNEIT